MTLENIPRGTGDWRDARNLLGLRQIDPDSNRIYVKCVKHRDFSPCEPFIIEGRPHLDQAGYLDMPLPPGFAGELGSYTSQGGRPSTPDKDEKVWQAWQMKAEGKSLREIAVALKVGKTTVSRWLNPKRPTQ